MFLKVLIKQDKRGAESNSLEDYNLVPRAFPLKNGSPHPFLKGKALGTKLGGLFKFG